MLIFDAPQALVEEMENLHPLITTLPVYFYWEGESGEKHVEFAYLSGGKLYLAAPKWPPDDARTFSPNLTPIS